MLRPLTSIALAGLLSLSALLPVPGGAAQPAPPASEEKPYDEVFDENGEVRPQYRPFYEVYEAMTKKELRKFDKRSFRKDFQKDNHLNPLPRVITRSEFDVLERGVKQRGEALRLFLQDYYGGGTGYRRVIPEEVLRRIIERAGEAGFKGLVRPEIIAFPYGPDIIRTPDGHWAVIEDNPGYIGGRGDLENARYSLLKRQPKYAEAAARSPDPMLYYDRLFREARARALPPGGRVVMYMVPPYPDHEDDRLTQLFERYGVITVTPEDSKYEMKFDERGAYLQPRGGGARERVGYVFVDGEHKWVDPSHRSTDDALMISEAREFLKDGEVPKEYAAKLRKVLEAPGEIDVAKLRKLMKKSGIDWNAKLIKKEALKGFMEAVYAGKVATDYSPGVDFIGDKEFYLYVPELIRHYLREEPVIPNLPTWKLGIPGPDGVLVVNEEILRRLLSPEEFRKFVSKTVDGRGGDGVAIGKTMKFKELKALEKKIRAMFQSFITQKYTPLSKLLKMIADIRMISQVYSDGTYVAEVPWGRALPEDGNGKVNLSDQGRETTVLVVPDPEGRHRRLQRVRPDGCMARIRSMIEGR